VNAPEPTPHSVLSELLLCRFGEDLHFEIIEIWKQDLRDCWIWPKWTCCELDLWIRVWWRWCSELVL